MATLRELLGDSYKEGMTLEEAEAALSGKKLFDLSSGEYVSKAKWQNAVDKSEELKKALQDRYTEEERKNAEQEEKLREAEKILRENRILKAKEKLSASITDHKVVSELAEMYVDGKILDALEKQAKYQKEAVDRAVEEAKKDSMRRDPRPRAKDSDAGQVTKEQFEKMGYDERLKLYNEDKERYKELTKGD